jgi:ribosomal protein RSM22 (predicted rRNA methylase)
MSFQPGVSFFRLNFGANESLDWCEPFRAPTDREQQVHRNCELPAYIRATLDEALDHVSRADLRVRSQMISKAYRSGGASDLIRTEFDAFAYSVVRMPATYSAICASLSHAAESATDFQPEAILDIGAGPGTASWAGKQVWPSLLQATLVDANRPLLDVARRFSASGPADLRTFIAEGLIPDVLTGLSPADLVVAGYSLTEIAPHVLPGVLASLWHLARKMMILVEPGTPEGFRRILQYRDVLVAAGGEVMAPCSHTLDCPLERKQDKWCHFNQRLARVKDHKVVKDASLPFEDEKFIYLAVGKNLGHVRRGARILSTPKVNKAAVTLRLCAPAEIEERVILRRDGSAYKHARHYDWGDLVDSNGTR